MAKRKSSSNNSQNNNFKFCLYIADNQRCPGSYEAAVESGAHKAIEMRRTKRILKIRKQDSYTRAIGGSFEDEHSRSEARKERSGMKKQDSYLRAVGEVSPDTESKSDFSSISEINIRKQDSYIEAIRLLGLIRFSHQCHVFRSTSPLDEVPELPSRSRTTRRQASYLQAVQPDHLSAGERATFRSVPLQPLSSARSHCFIFPIFTGLKEKFSDRLIFRMSQFLPTLNCLLAAITYV